MKNVRSMKMIIILCVMISLFVSGCGISGGETDSAGKDVQTGDGEPKKAAVLPEKFRLEDEKEEGKEGEENREEPYYVREYADYENDNFPEGDLSVAGCRQYQKRQFILNRIFTSREEQREENVYVECYQENQLAPETRKIRFEQEEIKDGSIESFDVWEEGYVFAVARWDQDEEGLKQRRYAVYADWEGAPVKVLETATETISRTGELPASYQLYVDEKGNLYEVYSKNILVRNPEGQQIGSLDLSEERRSAVARVLKEDSGSLVVAVSLGQGQYRFLSLNEEGKWQERGVLDFKKIVDFVGISGGEIYLCDSSDLVAWNADSGSRRRVIPLSKLGYSPGSELVLLGDPEGDFRVRCISSQEDYVMLLSREKGFNPDSISLVSLGNSGMYWDEVVRGCGDFNRKTPGCSIEAQLLQEKDSDLSRFLMDFIVGEDQGSDILFVREEDMKMLAEAGVLADLNPLLSEETRQALYPVVLELGTHEGMLAGLALQIDMCTMMTRRSFWDGETWTMQDIQKILAERPEIREVLTEWAGSLSGRGLLYYLYGYDLENSGLYDRETGESHFKDMEFASVLEMAKKYTMNTVEKNGYEKLEDGEALATVSNISSFNYFSEEMSRYNEDSNMIGFPASGTATRHIASAKGYLVVNKRSQKQESIRRFLEYMVGADFQSEMEGGFGNVRRDIIEHCVRRNWEKKYVWASKRGDTRLKVKKDGTPYTQEWEAFLSECRPGRRCQEIWDIVTEESDQFFGGTLDARSAVERIDSRVSLYLKEQK